MGGVVQISKILEKALASVSGMKQSAKAYLSLAQPVYLLHLLNEELGARPKLWRWLDLIENKKRKSSLFTTRRKMKFIVLQISSPLLWVEKFSTSEKNEENQEYE